MKLLERLSKDHYTDANGNMIFTERFLLKQGCCCGNGCKHCPYDPESTAGGDSLRPDIEEAWTRTGLG